MTSIIFEFLKLIDDNGIILLALTLIFYIVVSVSFYYIYSKIGISKKKALIPIYNIIVLLDVVSLPKYLIILIFCPYVNIVGIFIMNLLIGWRLGKLFNCNFVLKLGLIFLPIVFYPILSRKKLVYKKNETKKEEIEEMSTELVVDVPSYNVNISSVSNIEAIDINDYNQVDSLNRTTKSSISEVNEVSDLTFDYNKLYNINNKVESELNMNQDGNFSTDMFINNQVSDTPVVKDVGVSDVEDTVIPIPNIVPQGVVAPLPEANISTIPDLPPVIPQAPVMPSSSDVASLQASVIPDFDAPFVTQGPKVSTPVMPSQSVNQPNVVSKNSEVSNLQENKTLEIVDGDKKIILPTKDGITVDYNTLYNVETIGLVQNNNNNKDIKDKEVLDALNMAAPPSFELPVEEVEEELPTIAVPEIKKEDLVSVKIDEPDALPVANIGIKIKPEMDSYNNTQNEFSSMNQSMRPNNMMISNPSIGPSGGMVGTNNGMMPPGYGMPQNNGMTPPGYGMPQNNMMPSGYNNGPMPYNNVPNDSLLRANEDSRAQEHANRGVIGSKFITNDDTKYTLPKAEPAIVQMPTDPELIANPMAIFGLSSGTIRPTSEEAMRQNNISQSQQQSIAKCPNCGFPVKKGQPTCVVCGYRL